MSGKEQLLIEKQRAAVIEKIGVWMGDVNLVNEVRQALEEPQCLGGENSPLGLSPMEMRDLILNKEKIVGIIAVLDQFIELAIAGESPKEIFSKLESVEHLDSAQMVLDAAFKNQQWKKEVRATSSKVVAGGGPSLDQIGC